MVLYGTNTIKACLEAKTLIKVMMTKEFSNKALINSLKKSGVKIEYVSKEKLNEIAPGNNQGIAALVKDIYPVSLNEVIALTKKQKEKGEVPLVIILDSLTDPHNLGAVLRSADAFDAKAVIYKKHGSVSLNATVAKVSTGAINFVKCADRLGGCYKFFAHGICKRIGVFRLPAHYLAYPIFQIRLFKVRLPNFSHQLFEHILYIGMNSHCHIYILAVLGWINIYVNDSGICGKL